MVFSYYLYKYPYKITWHLLNLFKLNPKFVFYCADPLDYEMFTPIQKYLPQPKIIAKNKKTREYLDDLGIKYGRMPSFPKVVVMGRHMPYKFPVESIRKIGFDHGLYQFKRWTSPKNYNGFDVYFVSSNDQVKTANSLGITSVKAIGYPKLDKAFSDGYDQKYISNLCSKLGIDSNKKTVLFSTTWDVAGLSAIDKWINEIEALTDEYNILVTVHTWTKDKYKDRLRSMKNVNFIEEFDAAPYLMISDLMVGDYSSILGEFCAFNKPIITFNVPDSDRTIPEVKNLLKQISITINDSSEIRSAIRESFKNPDAKSDARKKANRILFYALDGKAGKRAANEIMKFMDEL